MLEVVHAHQPTRPSPYRRQCMQRHLFHPPLQITRLHLVVAIEEEGDAANRSGVEDGVYGQLRDDIKADECDGG